MSGIGHGFPFAGKVHPKAFLAATQKPSSLKILQPREVLPVIQTLLIGEVQKRHENVTRSARNRRPPPNHPLNRPFPGSVRIEPAEPPELVIQHCTGKAHVFLQKASSIREELQKFQPFHGVCVCVFVELLLPLFRVVSHVSFSKNVLLRRKPPPFLSEEMKVLLTVSDLGDSHFLDSRP